MRASPVPVSCEAVCCKTLAHRAIDGWMLLLSALLMPCTPFRIGPTRIERELAELEQAAEQAGLDGVRLPFELDLVPAMFQHLLSTGALNRRHVLYQSVDRFCAEALGLESELWRADPSRRGSKRKIRGTHNSCYEVVMLAVITTSGMCYECYEVL